ncbi:peptidylprolyl isomerase, partial [Candidatus Bipolaricaulota bacterium]
QQGKTVESFKADSRAYIANQQLAMAVQLAVAGPLDITDQQIEEYFATNRASYDVAEQVRASHILVETREEAEQILDQLSEGADFANLAREHSTDPGSGAKGGDLNWFGLGTMVAPFEEAAFSLLVGETSDIVETDFGYHIILLTERQEAVSAEMADIIEQVRSDLTYELRQGIMDRWYEEAYSSAEIVIYDPALEAAVRQRDIEQRP